MIFPRIQLFTATLLLALSVPAPAATLEKAEAGRFKTNAERAATLKTISRNVRWLLGLRYRIQQTGLEDIKSRGTDGILFLGNHSGFTDPLINQSLLLDDFAPRALIIESANAGPGIGAFTKKIDAIPVPDPNWKKGKELVYKRKRDLLPGMQKVVDGVLEGARRGDNWLIYPSGTLKHQAREIIERQKSIVHRVLQDNPDQRIVLIRMKGLWGSDWSWAGGKEPNVPLVALKSAGKVIANALMGKGMPKRDVTVEFVEPTDFPRRGTRAEINAYLEAFYNADGIEENRQVPYYWWQGEKQD